MGKLLIFLIGFSCVKVSRNSKVLGKARDEKEWFKREEEGIKGMWRLKVMSFFFFFPEAKFMKWTVMWFIFRILSLILFGFFPVLFFQIVKWKFNSLKRFQVFCSRWVKNKIKWNHSLKQRDFFSRQFEFISAQWLDRFMLNIHFI